jgi:hypothetical protein
MFKRSTVLLIAGLLLSLAVTIPAAQAGEKCSLKTMAGTYVFSEKGSSSILDMNPSDQTIPIHWPGAIAPFVTVGEVTFTPDGIGDGFYWILVGSLTGGSDPIPVQVTIFEMNPDCTGKFRYWIDLPGAPSATLIEERFVAFDDGSEFRSVPSLIGPTGIPTLAWTGTGHRIRKSGEHFESFEQGNSCGPRTAHGTYLLTAENIVNFGPAPPSPFADTGFADALLIREDVSITGNYTGTLYEKLGPASIDKLSVFGKYNVYSDCSFSSTLNFYVAGNPTLVTIVIKGVFFNEGKEYFALAIDEGVPYSFAQGKRISK